MTTYAKSPSSSSSSPSPSSPKKSSFARLCRKLSPKSGRTPSLDQVEVDQVVESQQQQQLRMVFNYMDEDGDGKISPVELRSCVGAAGGQLSREEAEAAVACSDKDGDGHLGFEEFCSLMETSHETEEEKVKELREAFGMYAAAMEECITPGSLRRMLGRLGESRSLEDCKAIVRVFDLNGDGVLTFDEFALMMR
ncbi:Calcium-binding protein CML38 [Morus notabilis]|uniref:Calcium-binding protein CML38 n=1 Tax=Morus notabilis TaxID=981085 RepID=W9R4H3_9ROSA|nr:calcium-binding protein CML39 [Morus notabilis]EXB56236.1 Calcium-binding protein CML38 [Morus notabilis]